MSSPNRPDAELIDLERDVPTTPEDIAVLRRLARETPSWLALTPAELDALLPERALDERPTSAGARPFVLAD